MIKEGYMHACLHQLYGLHLGSHEGNGECQAAGGGPGGSGDGVSWQHKDRDILGKWVEGCDRIDTGRNPGPRLRFLLKHLGPFSENWGLRGRQVGQGNHPSTQDMLS